VRGSAASRQITLTTCYYYYRGIIIIIITVLSSSSSLSSSLLFLFFFTHQHKSAGVKIEAKQIKWLQLLLEMRGRV